MRYILVRCKGKPPKERPVGMKDIVGMGEYKTLANAVHWMHDKRHYGEDAWGRDMQKAEGEQGYTHYGLYESPPSLLVDPDPLVKTFENPWAFLNKEQS